MSKVLLVNRIQRGGGVLTTRRRAITVKRVEPLGLEYLSAVLQRAGHGCTILDDAVEPERVDGLEREIGTGDYQLVGFYAADGNLETVIGDLRRLADSGCDVPLVVGGPGTQQPAPLLAAGADLACVGEGERTVLDLVDLARGRLGREQLQGVAWLDGDEVRWAPPRPLIDDLDEIPHPDRSQVPPDTYFDLWNPGLPAPSVSMLASRGCPNRCAFCTSPRHWGHSYRLRGVDDTLAEIDELVAGRGLRSIGFKDDVFGVRQAWLAEFCGRLQGRGYGLSWTCHLSPRSVERDRDASLAAMARAGCAAVKIGLQAVDGDVLLRVGRDPADPARVEELVRSCRRAGILTIVEFIFGLPGATPETEAGIDRYARRLKPDLVAYYTLMPIAGSAIFEEYGEGEVSEHLTREQARDLARAAARRYYLRPGFGIRALRRIVLRNPGWLAGAVRHLPSVLDRVGVDLLSSRRP